MSNIQQNKGFNNIAIVKSSLKEDKHTYRWFMKLILLSQVKSELRKNAYINGLYSKLQKSLAVQHISLAFILLFCTFFITIDKPLNLTIILIPLWLGIKAYIKKRRYILEISSYLISRDFNNDSASAYTLYQVTEYYSRRYGVPSLVDILHTLDTISIITILSGMFFIRFFGLGKSSVNNCVLLMIWYLTVYFIVNFSFLYKKLK